MKPQIPPISADDVMARPDVQERPRSGPPGRGRAERDEAISTSLLEGCCWDTYIQSQTPFPRLTISEAEPPPSSGRTRQEGSIAWKTTPVAAHHRGGSL